MNLGKYMLVLATVATAILLAGCSSLGLAAPSAARTTAATPVALALPSIADVVAQVEPSVVAIDTEAVSYDMSNRARVQKGAGSGWILEEGGIIVTNNHVIEGATTVIVTFKDKKALIAEVAGADEYTDIAILKVKNAGKLPVARVGDSSKIRVGDWVVVIGNPLGFGISAKQGIVSRLGVSLRYPPGKYCMTRLRPVRLSTPVTAVDHC